MSLETELRNFYCDQQPRVILGPNITFFRGISLPVGNRLRDGNDEAAWFCQREESALGYANWKGEIPATPFLMIARNPMVLEVLQISLRELTDHLLDSDYGPRNGPIPYWQKETLLPALAGIWGIDGIYDRPTKEFWLTAGSYDVVEAGPVDPRAPRGRRPVKTFRVVDDRSRDAGI
jgi:hypothetical protein